MDQLSVVNSSHRKKTSSESKLASLVAKLRETLGDQAFEKWIADIEFDIDEQQHTLYLTTLNVLKKRWVVQNYRDLLQDFVHSDDFDKSEHQWKVVFNHKNAVTSSRSQRIFLSPVTRATKNFSDNSNLRKNWNFDNFIEGTSNRFAVAIAKEIANSGETNGNPVVFYSLSGMGKSHLVQSIVKHRQTMGVKNVAYVRSERYFREFFLSIDEKKKSSQKNDDFSNFYRKLDLLIIDDIHFFAGKERTQEEFFHTFNSLYERGKQMVFTSDSFPKGMKGIEPRISSRFGMGVSIAIEPPDLETRMAILLNKAQTRGFTLSHDCALYMAEIVKSNVRELEGALGNVTARAKFHNVKVLDQAIIRDALADLVAQVERSITLLQIQKTVTDYYNIKQHDILSPSKSRSFTRPRQMAMLLSKDLTNKSLPEIGQHFGGRDHSTVIYAIQKMRDLMKENHSVYNDYRNLERIILT